MELPIPSFILINYQSAVGLALLRQNIWSFEDILRVSNVWN